MVFANGLLLDISVVLGGRAILINHGFRYILIELDSTTFANDSVEVLEISYPPNIQPAID